MADEQTTVEQEPVEQEPAVAPAAQEPQGTEIDWKREARKWERLAKKAGKAAPDGADFEQRLSEMAEQLRALEEERDRLRHETDLRTWADEVATETHVPASVLRGSTKEELTAHAQALKAAGFGMAVPDGGEPHGTPAITREQIESTANAVDRVRLRAQHIDLYK